jgi:hypothetical protein
MMKLLLLSEPSSSEAEDDEDELCEEGTSTISKLRNRAGGLALPFSLSSSSSEEEEEEEEESGRRITSKFLRGCRDEGGC